ncbi:hypothetical protein [Segniliparus rugosus]|uniref:Minor tail protein n=1 Tax=Segniliparus rugosus (strain ATCC BAA-974 / DSM 45345 / CCUG 50838 / CIP 108380 / JCM 13579 / CDC 945) TaxID=679197 RepID=E5XRS0_SEGRC|nr:hypothetical protein [Segniliparus rugosus]EFV12935.2 hypothetical protein HMPREF9336_02192 [Segniliparus rugosus ATCC BAA-974]
MNGHTEIAAAVSAPIGALLGAVGKGWLERRKRRQELSLSEAQESKIDAEAAQVIAVTAVTLVDPLRSQVADLGKRVEVLEQENAATKSTLHQALDYIRSLLSWVHKHLPDKTPPQPPATLGI